MNRRDLIRSLAFIPLGAFLPKPEEDVIEEFPLTVFGHDGAKWVSDEEFQASLCGVADCPIDCEHYHWEFGASEGCTAEIPVGCDEAMKEHMEMTMRIFLNGREVSPPVIKTERDTLSIAYTPGESANPIMSTHEKNPDPVSAREGRG